MTVKIQWVDAAPRYVLRRAKGKGPYFVWDLLHERRRSKEIEERTEAERVTSNWERSHRDSP